MISALVLALLAEPTQPPPPPAPVVHVIDEKERVRLQQTDVVRLSLPTQEDVDAWNNGGLRVALGYGYGTVRGTFPALSFRSHLFALRPSVRLDRHWSAGVSLMYGTGPDGVRWSLTAEPAFHPWRQLSIAFGVGYGGLAISDWTRGGGLVQNQAASRTAGKDEPFSSCTGSALSTLGRIDYLFVAGPLFASGPFLQADAQWTRCREYFGDEPATGRPYTYTQWWQQTGATLGWWFAWR